MEQDDVNIFLFFQVQRHIDLVLNDIGEDEILTQRPIIINRLKLILRKELLDIGLELVDFRRISLWSHGAADRGVGVADRLAMATGQLGWAEVASTTATNGNWELVQGNIAGSLRPGRDHPRAV